jgi:HPt (histidine-containing phosphotransfer) domain-containing protein
MSSGISVPVESQIKYLRRRSDEIQQIKNSLKSTPDWELIKKVGHQVKGNASTFGFPELTDLGKRLEAVAATADSQGAAEASASLEKEVARLLTTLE